jgi:hypothetical protein
VPALYAEIVPEPIVRERSNQHSREQMTPYAALIVQARLAWSTAQALPICPFGRANIQRPDDV